MTYFSPFLKILSERGFIHQVTHGDGLDKLLSASNVTAYIGFDCTAPSLHAGSLVQIMMLRWLQKCGHTPIVLVGGGTTKIGDPSGKDASRKMLTIDEIESNKRGIKKVFNAFLDFGDGKALMVDNAEWLDNLNYVEFLRDYGSHFSINHMLSMESVKNRLEREQHLSFLEFNYMILQAYDFVELRQRYNCRLQMGGSDQWGNIVTGIELGRRVQTQAHSEVDNSLFGLTTPLLTTSSGAKMGKTAQGAVWLDADMLSPYDFWQYFRNVEDADLGKFLRLFTELEIEEIEQLEKSEGAKINEAKKILATEVTKLVHGEDEAVKALQAAQQVFYGGGTGDGMPEISISADDAQAGIALNQLLVQANLAESNGEAKRLIRGKGVKLNGITVENEAMRINITDFQEGVLRLSKGQKKHALVKIV